MSFLQTSLTLLDIKMDGLDSNIESCNLYVKAQIKSLLARGEASSDLLLNLFKGYKVANDVKFLDFVRRKENAYEEGEDINTNNLSMADALVKSKARKLVGQWSAPTKEQGQILALTACRFISSKRLNIHPSRLPVLPKRNLKPQERTTSGLEGHTN
jgi:hypothetical protein